MTLNMLKCSTTAVDLRVQEISEPYQVYGREEKREKGSRRLPFIARCLIEELAFAAAVQLCEELAIYLSTCTRVAIDTMTWCNKAFWKGGRK
jgi:hypothetical protein